MPKHLHEKGTSQTSKGHGFRKSHTHNKVASSWIHLGSPSAEISASGAARQSVASDSCI